MFNKKFEERLQLWREFREGLETAEDPIQSAINFYLLTPTVSRHVDPYTPSDWPDPWELLEENEYCEFGKILAICYSLQLTDCLSQETFEIHITQDREKSATYYLLFVGDRVIGYNGDTHVDKAILPKRLHSQLEHVMPNLL
jgi:tRNA A37 threonylcarbamoyladenosine biosynthesis protein TsaE